MLRIAVSMDHPFNIVVLDYTTSEEVKEICTAISNDKNVLSRIDALVILIDPVSKKDFSANNNSSPLPIHVITKPLMRSKLRALLVSIFQGTSALRRSTSLTSSSQSIVQLPSSRSPSSLAFPSSASNSPSSHSDGLDLPATISSSPSISSSIPTSLPATEPHQHKNLRGTNISPSSQISSSSTSQDVYNVMLAEDNAINTKVLVKYLKQLDLNIHAVTNGMEAVELFASKPLGYFSLILMDCHMPTMDGFQATEEIRRIEMGQAHVPIVSLTANVMPGIVEQCVQAGMDYYLSKPVNFSQLKDIIRGIILQN